MPPSIAQRDGIRDRPALQTDGPAVQRGDRRAGTLARIVLAAITFTEILQLLLLIIVLHAVLLAPFMIAGFFAWLEYHQNQRIRRSRRI